MTWYNDKTGNFYVGEQPTKEVYDGENTIIEDDLDYVVIADKPSENYYYDGSVWIAKEVVPMTKSELKAIGLPFTLNGINYQVPLTKDTQDTVVAVAVAFQMGGISSTVLEFENGVTMPISQTDFMPFATWFSKQRNSFFVGV